MPVNRSRGGVVGLVVGLMLTASGTSATAADTPVRPNIIVVLADDLGYGDLGCYGSPVIKTPNLDRFATEGVRLTACYAAAPNCSPSRAGLLTGRTPYRVGVYDVIPGNANMRLREQEVTVAELLKGVGYDTYHAGKWHLTPERRKDKQQPKPAALGHGFDFSKSVREAADDNPLRAAGLVEDLTRWVGGRKDPRRPFFAYLALTEPHAPVEKKVDPPYRQRYEGKKAEEAARKVPYSVRRPGTAWENRTAYFGCVTQMDEAFGRLMKYLDAKLRENTFVLFISDNGPEHRGAYAFGSAGPFRGAKGHVYEGGIRVPGIVRWPGHTKPGMTCDEPISGTDVLPTLCALAGAKVPADRVIDGVNFLPALEGKKLARERPLY